MPDEAEAETTVTLAAPPENGGQKQRWPIWLAAGLAAIAAAAAVVSVVAWQSAEQSADDAETHAAEQAARVDEVTSELQAGEEQIADTQAEVQAMRAILQPGTPEALQGVYLQLIQAGCADPTADVEALITDVAADVSAGSTVLAGQPGWERAIDRDAVTQATAGCGTGNG